MLKVATSYAVVRIAQQRVTGRSADEPADRRDGHHRGGSGPRVGAAVGTAASRDPPHGFRASPPHCAASSASSAWSACTGRSAGPWGSTPHDTAPATPAGVWLRRSQRCGPWSGLGAFGWSLAVDPPCGGGYPRHLPAPPPGRSSPGPYGCWWRPPSPPEPSSDHSMRGPEEPNSWSAASPGSRRWARSCPGTGAPTDRDVRAHPAVEQLSDHDGAAILAVVGGALAGLPGQSRR